MLLIDGMACRYHCLPSQVVSQGDTLDVFIINAAIDLQRYHREAEEAERNGTSKPVPKMSQAELQAIVQGAKSGTKKSK